jgi:hypothetical protein
MEAAKQLLARLEELERDEASWLSLDCDLYPASALEAAAERLTGTCAIALRAHDGRHDVLLRVTPEQQGEDRSRIIREFFNVALSEAVRAFCAPGYRK